MTDETGYEEIEAAAISAMILLRQLARGEVVNQVAIEIEYQQLYDSLKDAGSLES